MLGSRHRALKFAFTLIVTSLIAGGSTAGGRCLAAEPPPDDLAPVRYRRILVPAEAPAAWPVGADKYLPIEAQEFNAWIAAADQPAATARIATAEYRARLAGRRFVDGSAAWTVELKGVRPAYLPLTDTLLLITGAQWRDELTAADETARLGWWPAAAGGAAYGLEVPRSGVLDFRWHTLPGFERGNALEIPLRLPAAKMTRLTLDVPDERRPVMEGSVVLESSRLEPPGSSTLAWRRWVLAVGEYASGHLRIEQAQGLPRIIPPAVSIHEDLRYRITKQGLDLEATLRLDRLAGPIRELSVTLPKALQLVAATANDQTVHWKTVLDPQTDAVRAVIDLPNVPLGDELAVALHAWGEPVLEQAWDLPRLRIEGTSWMSGTIQIAVDELLELAGFEPVDCIQTDVQRVELPTGQGPRAPLRSPDSLRVAAKRLAATRNGARSFEALTFQSYSPDAHVRIVVGDRPASGRVRSTTSLEVGVPDILGKVIARLNVDRGSMFAITAELQPGWLIDAVETIPADALSEWYVETRDGRRHLELRFGRAATRQRPVSILVTGRSQQAGSFEPLELKTLAMLRWHDLEVERNLLRLEATEPYELETLGDPSVVAVSDLSDDDRGQVESPAEGQWFDLGSAASRAGRGDDAPPRVRLVPTRGTYDADIRLEAVIHGQWLRSTYRVSCRPRRSGVEELLIYFSEPLPSAPRWVNSDTGEPLAAQRLPDNDPRLGGVPAGGELWRLPLGRTYLGAAALSATARWPLVKRCPLPLLSLPEASGVQGRVAVGSVDRAMPSIEMRGLTPVPLPAGAQVSEFAAVYRYQPFHFYDVGTSPRLSLAPPAVSNAEAPLLAMSGRLESFYSATGHGVHRATYHLENCSQACVELALPAGAELDSVSLDNQPLMPSEAESSPDTLRVSLPRRWTGGVLTLNFRTEADRLAGGTRLQPPLPAANITVLSGAWRVWLPEELTPTAADPVFDWRQRIFGPLARPASDRPFNPLRADNWLAVWPGTESPPDATMVVHGSPDPARLRGPVGQPATSIGDPTQPVALAAYDSSDAGSPRASDGAVVPSASSPRALAAPQGWHAFDVGFVAGGPKPVTLLDAPTSTAWSLAIFLACLCGLALYQPRATHFVAMVTAAVVLSVLLPAVYAPLATGAFLGLLFSPICRWIVRWSDTSAQRRGQEPQPDGGSTVADQTSLMLVSAVGLVFALAGASSAQVTASDVVTKTDVPLDANDAATGAATTIHRVLVPVDDAGKRVGTKYFVSEPFAQRLLRMSQPGGRERGSWLLLGMRCDGDLSHRTRGPAASLGDWTLSLEVEVLRRDAIIELPLAKRQAEWAAAASLDGIPAPLAWNESGLGCRVQVREPGQYQLSLRFEPRVSLVAGRRQLELSLPPLPGATLRLTASQPLADPVAVGAPLERQEGEAGAVWTGELDGSGRVALDWTDPTIDASAGAAPQLDELRWLRIEPNDTFLDVKYVLGRRGTADGDTHWPTSIVLWVDRRCELVADVDDGASGVVDQLPDGRQSVTIPAEREAAGGPRRDVHLRFRVRGAAPLGHLRVPTIELVALPVKNRWLAVTVDPALDCVPVGELAIASETAADFAAMWGRAKGAGAFLADDAGSTTAGSDKKVPDPLAAPQLVLTGDEPENAWSLAVRPRRTESEQSQWLLVAVGQERFRLVYQSDVTPRGTQCFGGSLSVPENFAIESVTAEQADAPLPLRWVRAAPDRVNVFFAAKTTAPYRLTLGGAVPLPGRGEHRLPRVGTFDTQQASPQKVSLYRDDDVIATVRSATPAVAPETDLRQVPPAEWNTRFVGSYTVDPQAADAVHVLTEPNRVRLDGRTLTTLENDGGLWFATFAVRLRVEEGELDTLELGVPSTWVGPFEVPLAAVGAVVSATEGEFATLKVQLSNPVRQGEMAEFEIRSVLTVATGRPVTVPRIVPQAAGRWEHFVSVPTSIDAGPPRRAWSRTGVEPADRPTDLLATGVPPGDFETYRVASERFRVALRSPEKIALLSAVRLAEMWAVVGPAGGQFMVTRFTIVPQGLSECVLELPDDQRLTRVTLDGRPAVTRPLGGQRYWVQLGPPNLPQTLDIVARAAASTNADFWSLRLRRPSLSQLDQPVPVELSLWSLCRPATTASERVTGAALLTAGDRSALRLERLVSISEAATRAVIESPVADGYNWFVHWSETLQAAERAAGSQQIDSAGLGQVPPEVAPADESRNLVIQRSEAWITQAEELFAISGATGAGKPSEEMEETGGMAIATPPGCVWAHYVAAGDQQDDGLPAAESGQAELHIEWVPEELSPLATRIIVLSCVIVLAAAVGWFANQPPTRDLFTRWPYATAALIGLAAWAWLRPSWLGLAIAVVSLSLWLREKLRNRRSEGWTLNAEG